MGRLAKGKGEVILLLLMIVVEWSNTFLFIEWPAEESV